MVTVIIFALIGIGTPIFLSITNVANKFDKLEIILASYLGSIASLGFGCLIALAIPVQKEIKMNAYNISPLPGGSSYLSFEPIGGEMKCVIFCEKDSIFKLKQFKCKNVSIKYSNSTAPKLEVHEEIRKEAFINYFAIQRLKDEFFYTKKYILYIPNGTISKKLN